MHRGWILSDIDGTLTTDRWTLPEKVVNQLTKLHAEGWGIGLVSGRTFPHCQRLLSKLSFPYLLAVHNGALVLQMPERKVLVRHYLSGTHLQRLAAVLAKAPMDWVVYAGAEQQDRCFYSPSAWDPELLGYIHGRRDELEEGWHALSGLQELPIQKLVAAKSFGPQDKLHAALEEITQRLGLHAPLIKDPYNPAYCVLQVTGGSGNKGQAAREILEHTGLKGPVIAAGNDLNDLSLLEQADIAIAMEDSPPALFDLADIIAASAQSEGICDALAQAVTAATR